MRPFKLPAAITTLCAACLLGGPAAASAPTVKTNPVFACSPDTFTLSKEEGGMRLRGAIAVSGPGYSYDVTEEEPGPDGSIHAALRLLPPSSKTKETNPNVPISYLFRGEGDRITVVVDGGGTQGAAIQCWLAPGAP
jgi:hypothetical protein